MKKCILLIFFSISFISCGTYLISEHKTEEFYELAYKKYIEKGFLFCRSQCVDEYQSLGTLTMQAYPSLRIIQFSADSSNDELTHNGFEKGQLILNYDEVIDSFYTYAVKLGADAVINLDIRKETDIYGTRNISKKIVNSGNGTKEIMKEDGFNRKYTWIELSGHVIKRKIRR